MSVWIAASIVLVCALVGCGIACIGSPLAAGMAVLNIAGLIAVVLLVTLTEAFGRQPFMDLAEALAAASLAGGLAFVRFLDRRR